jgi:metal-responsive CopG/Arc/MetJ family transcriptional regulator
MKTIEINVPDEILDFLGSVSREREKFVLEAIREKVNREKKRDLKTLLAEGYRTTAAEDFEITKEFEAADLENL